MNSYGLPPSLLSSNSYLIFTLCSLKESHVLRPSWALGACALPTEPSLTQVTETVLLESWLSFAQMDYNYSDGEAQPSSSAMHTGIFLLLPPTTLMCTKDKHGDLLFKSTYLQNVINGLGITVEGSLQGNTKKEAAWVCLFTNWHEINRCTHQTFAYQQFSKCHGSPLIIKG